jgi:hypothetical protein
MACWNALSTEQQDRLINLGNLEFGYTPEGTECDRGAEVEVTTMYDESPGPRFYCIPCAQAYLAKMRAVMGEPTPWKDES